LQREYRKKKYFYEEIFVLSFRKNRNNRNKNVILDAKMFKILTMTPTFLLLKAELSFDKNGIQSMEWLFAMCSKSRSGAKSVRLMKMIVRHLSNGRYKILAPRTGFVLRDAFR